MNSTNESIKFDKNFQSLQTTKSDTNNSSINFSKLLQSDSTGTNSSIILSDFSAGQLNSKNAKIIINKFFIIFKINIIQNYFK